MDNPYKGQAGIKRVARAAVYSWEGLKTAYLGEAAFRQETWLAVALIPAAFWLASTWVEATLLAGTVMLVLIVELLNSALEAVVDRVSYERHDLSKRAKDFASAAVLLSIVLCACVWGAALWRRFV